MLMSHAALSEIDSLKLRVTKLENMLAPAVTTAPKAELKKTTRTKRSDFDFNITEAARRVIKLKEIRVCAKSKGIELKLSTMVKMVDVYAYMMGCDSIADVVEHAKVYPHLFIVGFNRNRKSK